MGYEDQETSNSNFNKLQHSIAGKKGNVHITLFSGEGCYTMVKYKGLLLLSYYQDP